jgi:hypothetical protein
MVGFGRNIPKKIIFSIIISLPLIFLLSCRYGIGTDYFNYYNSYMYYEKYGVIRFDVGVVFIINMCIHFFQSFQGFIVITSIITVFIPFLALFICSKSYLWLQTLALACLYMGLWCTAIRQSLALGFVFVAICFMLRGRKCLYVICILFGTLFHMSCALLLPFVFLISKNDYDMNIRQWKIVLSTFLILFIVLAFFFWGRDNNLIYSSYLGSTREGGLTSNYFKLSLLFWIPEFFCLKKVCLQEKQNVILYIMIICEMILYALAIFVPHAFRMGHYFSLAHVFLIPQLIFVCDNRNSRFNLISYYVLCFLFYFFITTFIYKYNGIFEYKTIFSLG